jgi:uncharacterized membrane protein
MEFKYQDNMRSCYFQQLLFLAVPKNGLVDNMITYLRTQLGVLLAVQVSVDSKVVLFLVG